MTPCSRALRFVVGVVAKDGLGEAVELLGVNPKMLALRLSALGTRNLRD